MTVYVLDASVAAKWFFTGTAESLPDEATDLLKDFARGLVSLVLPDLF